MIVSVVDQKLPWYSLDMWFWLILYKPCSLGKTEHDNLSKNTIMPTLYLDGEPIEEVQSFRYLGVLIRSDLK